MRVEDEYKFGCNNIGFYAGEDPRPAFKEFLELGGKREGILPGWLSARKRRQCEKMAVDTEAGMMSTVQLRKAIL